MSGDGIIVSRLRQRLLNYRTRNEHVIYAHMLDSTVWRALRPMSMRTYVSEHTLLGELLHLSVSRILQPAGEKCREVEVPPGIYTTIPSPVRRRFVLFRGMYRYVVVCGSPDGILDGEPVEFKSTKRNISSWIPESWLRRPKIYGWLWGSRRAWLIIINVLDLTERDIPVESYVDQEFKRILYEWLRGRWPQRSLPYR